MNLLKAIIRKSGKKTRDPKAVDLKVIGEPIPESDTNALSEQAFFDKARYDREVLENIARKQNIEERKRYAGRLFKVIVCWFTAVFALLLLEGLLDHDATNISFQTRWGNMVVKTKFHLSDTVLLAVIGGTTANIVALFYVVAKYLFPPRSTEEGRALI